MINQAKLKIPYPKRIWFFSINFSRTVNFSFDNLALFLFRERQKIESSEDFAKWQKNKGQFDYLIHVSFSAAESYCLQNKKKFDLDFKKYAIGFSQANKEDIEKLVKVWKDSMSYGATQLPGKKKAKVIL